MESIAKSWHLNPGSPAHVRDHILDYNSNTKVQFWKKCKRLSSLTCKQSFTCLTSSLQCMNNAPSRKEKKTFLKQKEHVRSCFLCDKLKQFKVNPSAPQTSDFQLLKITPSHLLFCNHLFYIEKERLSHQ